MRQRDGLAQAQVSQLLARHLTQIELSGASSVLRVAPPVSKPFHQVDGCRLSRLATACRFGMLVLGATGAKGAEMASELQPMNVGGQTIWVEVDTVSAKLPVGASVAAAKRKTVKTSASGAANTAVGALEQVDLAKTLVAIVGPIQSALAAVKPEEVSVEISLGLKGEVGVFVAKSEGSASLKVTAKWKFAPSKTT